MSIDLQEAVEDLGQIDLAPESTGPEVNWHPSAEERAGAFHNGKPLFMPTPAIEACPHCNRPYDGTASLADEERSEIRQEALRDVLEFLGSGNDLKRMGWRCALSHWLIFRGESQQEFANRLRVSGGAISQGLKAFRAQIVQCLRVKDTPRQSPP